VRQSYLRVGIGACPGHQCKTSPQIDSSASPVTLIRDRAGVVERRMIGWLRAGRRLVALSSPSSRFGPQARLTSALGVPTKKAPAINRGSKWSLACPIRGQPFGSSTTVARYCKEANDKGICRGASQPALLRRIAIEFCRDIFAGQFRGGGLCRGKSQDRSDRSRLLLRFSCRAWASPLHHLIRGLWANQEELRLCRPITTLQREATAIP
jgi:hypothetical protein